MDSISSWSFRRRIYGPRCASPPTFVCYELPQPDSYSRSASPSSDDDSRSDGDDSCTESDSNSDEEVDAHSSSSSAGDANANKRMEDAPDNMEVDVPAVEVTKLATEAAVVGGESTDHPPQPDSPSACTVVACPNSDGENECDEKRRMQEKREGKRKEVDVSATECAEKAVVEEIIKAPETTEVEKKVKQKKRHTRRRNREEEPAPAIRPILTIRSSQGFVWNQDLFIPAYIKDRYIATSPPSSVASLHGTPPITKAAPLINNNFFSSSAGMDYEVECVEIRVQEGEMDGIIPRSS